MDMADWSTLPRDIYVVGAQCVDGIGYNVQCCSVPMALAPEVSYTRTDVVDAIRKVRDGYADQARFADAEPASYFREFVRRIDAALAA